MAVFVKSHRRGKAIVRAYNRNSISLRSGVTHKKLFIKRTPDGHIVTGQERYKGQAASGFTLSGQIHHRSLSAARGALRKAAKDYRRIGYRPTSRAK